MGLAVVLFGYLVPHLVHTRHQMAQSRVEDRFSTTLRVVTTGGTAKPPGPRQHHGGAESRPYLHDPRRRTEAPAVNRPTTPGERAAAEARRLAAARAARAAEISRRKAAARRRLVLTTVLLALTVASWLGVGVANLTVVAGVVPTVLLGAVLVLGRRAAKIASRRNAADRAAMARLELGPAQRTRGGQGATAAQAAAPAADAAPAAAPRRTEDGSTAVPEEDAPSSPVAEEAPAAATEDAAEDTPSAEQREWTPVPVPAPAYTLKAPAPRRDIAPYEAPQPEPAAAPAEEQRPANEPVVVAGGLAGSPYAPLADPAQPAPAAHAPEAPAARMDLDSVLARRRALGA